MKNERNTSDMLEEDSCEQFFRGDLIEVLKRPGKLGCICRVSAKFIWLKYGDGILMEEEKSKVVFVSNLSRRIREFLLEIIEN